MKKVYIIFVIIIISLITIGALILTGILPLIFVSYEQKVIGDTENPVMNGSWWGVNNVKIVSSGDKVFTYTLTGINPPWTINLFSKESNQEWEAGENIDYISRPPALLIDSNNYIHLIAFRSFFDASEHDGQLIHIKFDNANSVSGSYSTTEITPDWRSIGALPSTYSTYFFGASIGVNDEIVVVYANTFGLQAETYSLGARIFDPNTENWTYDDVATNLDARYAYPHVFVTENYYHVVAIEDEYDENIPDPGHPFRFGEIRYFSKLKSESKWDMESIINLKDQYDVEDILERYLNPCDLYIDSHDVVHLTYRYHDEADNIIAYHSWKMEDSTDWNSERISIITSYEWIRIWERTDGKLFYICSESDGQIYIMSLGSQMRYLVSSLNNPYDQSPTPFITTVAGGTDIGNQVLMVIYSAEEIAEATSISIDMSTILF